MSSAGENTGRPAMTAAVDGEMPTIVPPHERGGPWGKAGTAWAIFEFARNPYYLLVIIYIFAPYLAGVVGKMGLEQGLFADLPADQVSGAMKAHGQAFVAGVTKYAGYVAAISAPFLGAALDRGGKRKPLLFVILLTLSALSATLWFVKPDGSGLPLFWVGAILVGASICYTYSEVIHNSMLPDAGRPDVLPKISGNGLALGNLAGTIMMTAIVLFWAMPAMLGWPFAKPLFGVDVAAHEHERLAGPISAVWLMLFIWPFFLNHPDSGKRGASWIKAVKDGSIGIFNTLKRATHYAEAMKFLIARMVYADGMSALLALGAVYVAGALEWNTVELVGYAIWLSIFATLGGFVGGFLDRGLGVRNALLLELFALTIILFLLMSITQQSIFFGLIESERALPGKIYSHTHDWAYLIIAGFLGIFATACISSSRSMLVRVAPSNMVGEFFGLYAIAGTVTVWLGPLLVEEFTRAFNSQRVGMSTISILFGLGALVLLTVKHSKQEEQAL